MVRELARIVIGSIGLIGLFAGAILVAVEVLGDQVCPSFFSIPSCFIGGPGYALVFASALLAPGKLQTVLLALGTAAVGLMGIWFSVAEVVGTARCPSVGGFPLCFLSLLAFIGLIAASAVTHFAQRSGSGR